VPWAPLPAILLVLGTYLAVSVLGPALVAWRPDLAGSTVGGMLAMAIPATAASLYVLVRRSRARLEAGVEPTPRRRAVRAGAWTFCVASAVVVPATLAWVWFLHRVGVETDAQQAVLDAVEGPISHAWLITVYGVLLAPFTEEVIFRGLLHPSRRPTLGRRGAVIGVALLFALVHVNVHALVPLFVLALFLGRLLEETDSLLATFTVHALFNASSLLPILLFRYT
jgi:membrane protease YdiL (CAAX protease family)